MTAAQLARIEQRLETHDESIRTLRDLGERHQKSIEDLTRIQERQAADDRRMVRHRKELDDLHKSVREILDKLGEGRVMSAINSYSRERWAKWAIPIATAIASALITFAVLGPR